MRVPLQRFVTAIIEGRCADVLQAPPLRSLDFLRWVARDALAEARRPPFSDPRHIALALGAHLLPRAPQGMCGEGTAGDVIAYDWSAEPKLRGLLVAHGLAHRILRGRPEKSNESDAWWLTIMLLLPPDDVRPLTLTAVLAAAWAPEWCVIVAMAELYGCFPDVSEQSSRL